MWLVGLAIAALFQYWTVPSARAAEGGISYYLPGLYGDIAAGLAPEPGHYWFTTNTYYTATPTDPILPGQIDGEIDGALYLNLIRGFWVTDKKILGARYAASVRIPLLKVSVDADVQTPLGPASLAFDDFGLGDIGIIPVSLYWQLGRLNLNLYQTVTAPTGDYDVANLATVSRNQWSFDTVLAATWLDLDAGIEVTVIPGILVNTQNPTTNYRSGTEFHMDVMVNRIFSPKFAMGLHGSFYRQITGDSGTGAVLGSFKGRASSIGPALIYRPKVAGRQGYLSLKWLHEFDVENRFEGNLFTLTAGIKF
ncbi:MAG: transporter [Hyphomicrobiales bacterium]|nr:transporter [Hyphomicrobiales bacterium]